MSDAEKMAERLEERGKRTPRTWATSDLYYEAATLIRRLRAENEDFLEQITVQTESVLFKELQEIMKANNALHDENARLKQLFDLADALRAAQKAKAAPCSPIDAPDGAASLHGDA
jgi:cell division septum initiation protein DivIVA